MKANLTRSELLFAGYKIDSSGKKATLGHPSNGSLTWRYHCDDCDMWSVMVGENKAGMFCYNTCWNKPERYAESNRRQDVS